MDYSFLKDTGALVKSNAHLFEFTTFRLGGPCPCVITCTSSQQLESIIKKLNERKLTYTLIGFGSNLLISDHGLNCVVIRYVSEHPSIVREGNELIVSAATMLDQLVEFAANHALEGINFASGIPGTVGGAIVGNAGAFGKQIGDCVVSVIAMNASALKHELSAQDLDLRYRYSDLKEKGEIVLWARFSLRPGNREALLAERKKILEERLEKHPDWKVQPTAGSFFKNIEPMSSASRRAAAGWYLEQAGAKSMHVGAAYVFAKHANIIIKGDHCKAQDVWELSLLMQKAVLDKFNLTLTREVKLVGSFDGAPDSADGSIW